MVFVFIQNPVVSSLWSLCIVLGSSVDYDIFLRLEDRNRHMDQIERRIPLTPSPHSEVRRHQLESCTLRFGFSFVSRLSVYERKYIVRSVA